MEMKKAVSWVSESGHKKTSPQKRYDFLCPFFKLLQSRKKLMEK